MESFKAFSIEAFSLSADVDSTEEPKTVSVVVVSSFTGEGGVTKII